MPINRVLDLEVDVATLKQRINALEKRIYGRVDELPGPQPLFDLYTHLTLDGVQPTPETAILLRACVLTASPRLFLDLARMVNDPFPWRPFLSALDLMSVSGHDVAEATAWIEQCAEALLRAQGLRALRVEDVMRTSLGPVHELKAFALSVRKEGARGTKQLQEEAVPRS